MKCYKVLLMIGSSRASERRLLKGVAAYSKLNGPWVFYREPPFYRKKPAQSPRDRMKTLPELLECGLDGVVAFAPNAAHVDAKIPPGFPTVILPVDEKVQGRCCIVEESGAVGRMAAEHFLERGFRHFAFCGFDHMYWSRVRQEGFVQRLAQAGFSVDVYDFPIQASHQPWEVEHVSMTNWLKSLPTPVALMACNDDMAQQVIEANRLVGARIPDEIAILGVDNDEMICDLNHPPLSSIAMNFEKVGFEASAQLHLQMMGKEASSLEISSGPTCVHTRQSTDILAVEDAVVADALRFIRQRASNVVSVQDVVAGISTSRRLLERRFRRAIGLSIYQEIQRVHIELASRMLAETNWHLPDIARRCGFSNSVHFGVAFKRVTHMTPEQHRRRTQEMAMPKVPGLGETRAPQLRVAECG